MIYARYWNDIVVIVHMPTHKLQKSSGQSLLDARNVKQVSLFHNETYAQRVLDKKVSFEDSTRKRGEYKVIRVSVCFQALLKDLP